MKYIIWMALLSPLSLLAQDKIKLITVDPGHFHAALIQKSMYPQVDPTVHVYADQGRDLQMHLDRITDTIPAPPLPPAGMKPCIPARIFFQR